MGYANAGTLEFLYEDGQFYFNEMNTRIQVEHPVTEMVTGVDLVQWQIRIAAGEPLTLKQEDIALHGHAFEARINAEDPHNDFQPSPGRVAHLRLPHGDGVRVDSGLDEGWTVPAVYDSMVLKLLAWGPDREIAGARMAHALDELSVDGFTTNREFHRRLFRHAAFRSGDMSTRFLEEHDLMASLVTDRDRHRAAALIFALKDRPGGGLAGVQLDLQSPAVVAASPGRRDWRGV